MEQTRLSGAVGTQAGYHSFHCCSFKPSIFPLALLSLSVFIPQLHWEFWSTGRSAFSFIIHKQNLSCILVQALLLLSSHAEPIILYSWFVLQSPSPQPLSEFFFFILFFPAINRTREISVIDQFAATFPEAKAIEAAGCGGRVGITVQHQATLRRSFSHLPQSQLLPGRFSHTWQEWHLTWVAGMWEACVGLESAGVLKIFVD